MNVRALPLCVLVVALSMLCGCGGPPTAEARQEIEKAVRASRPDMFDGQRDAAAAEVTDIALAGWEQDDLGGMAGKDVQSQGSKWTASLRFKEPIGFVLVQVDGTKVVRVVADKGDSVAFAGRVHAMNTGSQWHVSAMTEGGGDAGPFAAMWQKAGGDGGVTMGYQVIDNGLAVAGKGRASYFEPLSRLQPCVVEGSAEEKEFSDKVRERQRQAIEASARQQQQRQEQQAAQQRAQQQERERAAAAAAEQQRLAVEAQQQQAAAARHQQLLPLLAPLQSPTGAVITTEAPAAMGVALLQIEVDAEQLTAKGHGIDLRQMPFREFAFAARVDTQSGVLHVEPEGGEALQFGLGRGAVRSRAGETLAALGDAVRAQIDSVREVGLRLQQMAPVEIAVETIEAAAAKVREGQLQAAALTGTMFYRGRMNVQLAPLFAGSLASNKQYTWSKNEVVAIRLNNVQKGSGIYIRGAAASDNLVVTINGVHRVVVTTIPRLGGALLKLPADLELFDLSLQAQGTVQARAIALIQ